MLLVRKPEAKRPLGRLRRRWIYNIILRERDWSGMDWIDLAQGKEHDNESSHFIK
jgi:hypothetical protein